MKRTPIEQKMYDSLHWAVSDLEQDATNHNLSPIEIFIEEQVKIGPYRVDFLLMGGGTAIVVECDGHKWHNFTRHQVSYDRRRDRWFASRGLTVVRFPGSDIWANPNLMAMQALALLCAQMARQGLGLPGVDNRQRDCMAKALAESHKIIDLDISFARGSNAIQ